MARSHPSGPSSPHFFDLLMISPSALSSPPALRGVIYKLPPLCFCSWNLTLEHYSGENINFDFICTQKFPRTWEQAAGDALNPKQQSTPLPVCTFHLVASCVLPVQVTGISLFVCLHLLLSYTRGCVLTLAHCVMPCQRAHHQLVLPQWVPRLWGLCCRDMFCGSQVSSSIVPGSSVWDEWFVHCYSGKLETQTWQPICPCS